MELEGTFQIRIILNHKRSSSLDLLGVFSLLAHITDLKGEKDRKRGIKGENDVIARG
jgi:hypothetical protein